MTGLHRLREESVAAKALIENFADILGDDDDAKLDMVEGETGFLDIAEYILKRIAMLEVLMAGIDEHARKLADRKKRLKAQHENLRTALGVAMGDAGLKKIEASIGTVSLRGVSPSVIVTEEADLPSRFLKTEVKIDRAALTQALKDGEDIPGATLSNGSQTITISRS